MKKYLIAILLCFTFILTACTPNLQMPTGDVYSNGGSVVMVGDYVYFSNTFVDYTSLSGNDNNGGEKTALYRIKTDEFGYTVKEDDVITQREKVFEKMTGFNNSNMFVFGDYLFYTSPNIHKENKTGNDLFNLTTLFRIKLDGTDNKEILTTQTIQGKFFVVTDENPYLLVFDNNKITKIDLNTLNQTVLAEDVEDAIFPANYSHLDCVYYTSALSEEETKVGLSGNYLNCLNLNTNTSTKLGKPASQTITLIAYENNVLYYRLLVDGESFYYSQQNVTNWGANEKQWTYFGDEITNFKPINDDYVIYSYDSKIYLAQYGQTPQMLISETANVQLVDGDYIYYSTDNGLFRISYRDKVTQTLSEMTDIKENCCDIAGEYIYYYAKQEGSNDYYCCRANIKTAELDRIKDECIAKI